jgi:DNA polymerase-3 subunit alpha
MSEFESSPEGSAEQLERAPLLHAGGAREFVHLHLHTEFSLLDGACHVDELVGQAARFQMRALAITDHGNMFGAVAFHDACRDQGIKPIIGCEIYVAIGSRHDRAGTGISEAYNHLTLLASNEVGYHNLMKLVSIGYTEGFYHRPRIDKEVLQKHSAGLVCLSGCLSSEIGVALRNGNEAQALRSISEFGEIFGEGRFFLEIMEHGLEEQQEGPGPGALPLRFE